MLPPNYEFLLFQITILIFLIKSDDIAIEENLLKLEVQSNFRGYSADVKKHI